MQPVIDFQNRMRDEVGKPRMTDYPVAVIEERDRERVVDRIGDRVADLVAQPMAKHERGNAFDALEDEMVGLLCSMTKRSTPRMSRRSFTTWSSMRLGN